MIIQCMPYPPPTGAFVGGKVAAAIRGTGTTDVSLTDLTGGLGSAPITGDIVIVAYGISSTGQDRDVQITTAGYTRVAELYAFRSPFSENFGMFYKVMGATPDTTVTLGQTFDADMGGHAAIHVWRSVKAASPMDVAPVPVFGTDGSNPDPGPINPATVGAVIIAAGGGCGNSVNFDTPADLSNFVTGWSAGSMGSNIGMGSAVWRGGTFDPVVWPLPAGGGGGYGWGACTLALRPA